MERGTDVNCQPTFRANRKWTSAVRPIRLGRDPRPVPTPGRRGKQPPSFITLELTLTLLYSLGCSSHSKTCRLRLVPLVVLTVSSSSASKNQNYLRPAQPWAAKVVSRIGMATAVRISAKSILSIWCDSMCSWGISMWAFWLVWTGPFGKVRPWLWSRAAFSWPLWVLVVVVLWLLAWEWRFSAGLEPWP